MECVLVLNKGKECRLYARCNFDIRAAREMHPSVQLQLVPAPETNSSVWSFCIRIASVLL